MHFCFPDYYNNGFGPGANGPCTEQNLPGTFQDQWKPIDWINGDPDDDGNSYRERADWIYNFAARYAPGSNAPACRLKLHPGDAPAQGTGLVTYLESWNEQDKYWTSPQGNGQFTAEEYALMSSVDFDGQYRATPGGPIITVQALESNTGCSPGSNYDLGFKNSSSGLRYVMGGLYHIDFQYVKDMNTWFMNRHPGGQFLFDVINFHNYSYIGDINSGAWACPENTNAAEGAIKGQLIQVRQDLASIGLEGRNFGCPSSATPPSPRRAAAALRCRG